MTQEPQSPYEPRTPGEVASRLAQEAAQEVYERARAAYGINVAVQAAKDVRAFYRSFGTVEAAGADFRARKETLIPQFLDAAASKVMETQQKHRADQFEKQYQAFILDPIAVLKAGAVGSRQDELNRVLLQATQAMPVLQRLFEGYYVGRALADPSRRETFTQELFGEYYRGQMVETLPGSEIFDTKLPVILADFFRESALAMIQGHAIISDAGPLTNETLGAAVVATLLPGIQAIIRGEQDEKVFNDLYDTAVTKIDTLLQRLGLTLDVETVDALMDARSDFFERSQDDVEDYKAFRAAGGALSAYDAANAAISRALQLHLASTPFSAVAGPDALQTLQAIETQLKAEGARGRFIAAAKAQPLYRFAMPEQIGQIYDQAVAAGQDPDAALTQVAEGGRFTPGGVAGGRPGLTVADQRAFEKASQRAPGDVGAGFRAVSSAFAVSRDFDPAAALNLMIDNPNLTSGQAMTIVRQEIKEAQERAVTQAFAAPLRIAPASQSLFPTDQAAPPQTVAEVLPKTQALKALFAPDPLGVGRLAKPVTLTALKVALLGADTPIGQLSGGRATIAQAIEGLRPVVGEGFGAGQVVLERPEQLADALARVATAFAIGRTQIENMTRPGLAPGGAASLGPLARLAQLPQAEPQYFPGGGTVVSGGGRAAQVAETIASMQRAAGPTGLESVSGPPGPPLYPGGPPGPSPAELRGAPQAVAPPLTPAAALPPASVTAPVALPTPTPPPALVPQRVLLRTSTGQVGTAEELGMPAGTTQEQLDEMEKLNQVL